MIQQTSAPDPTEQLLDMASFFWKGQLLHVAARMGFADAIADGPKTPEQIAAKIGGASPNMVMRVLRALASFGVFAEDEQGRFGHTPLSKPFESGHPSKMRSLMMYFMHNSMWTAWGALEHGVRTGKSAFTHAVGQTFWDYHTANPEVEALLADCMTAMAEPMADSIAAAYPFGDFDTVVDIGGSNGNLIAAILRQHPRAKGILFDLPAVIEIAPSRGYITAPDVKARIKAIGGSAMESVPEGHDCYITKSVIHDWGDEESIKILSTIRKAAAPKAKVLIAEYVIQPGNTPDFAKLMDLDMHICNEGQERTEAEFRKLLEGAGLRFQRIVPTASGMSLVESVKD